MKKLFNEMNKNIAWFEVRKMCTHSHPIHTKNCRISTGVLHLIHTYAQNWSRFNVRIRLVCSCCIDEKWDQEKWESKKRSIRYYEDGDDELHICCECFKSRDSGHNWVLRTAEYKNVRFLDRVTIHPHELNTVVVMFQFDLALEIDTLQNGFLELIARNVHWLITKNISLEICALRISSPITHKHTGKFKRLLVLSWITLLENSFQCLFHPRLLFQCHKMGFSTQKVNDKTPKRMC